MANERRKRGEERKSNVARERERARVGSRKGRGCWWWWWYGAHGYVHPPTEARCVCTQYAWIHEGGEKESRRGCCAQEGGKSMRGPGA